MHIQILCKKKPELCLEILKMNVDLKQWYWWDTLNKTPSYTVCGKFYQNKFKLRRKRTFPSFFTPIAKGIINEEDNGDSRLKIKLSLNFISKILLIFFLIIIVILLFFNLPIQLPLNRKTFAILAVIGVFLFLTGSRTAKPEEKYLANFLEDLFEDCNVIQI